MGTSELSGFISVFVAGKDFGSGVRTLRALLLQMSLSAVPWLVLPVVHGHKPCLRNTQRVLWYLTPVFMHLN